MRFGIYAPNFGDFSDLHNLLTLARAAEAAGWDGFFLWDHLLLNRTAPIPLTDGEAEDQCFGEDPDDHVRAEKLPQSDPTSRFPSRWEL